jgi:phage-related protein
MYLGGYSPAFRVFEVRAKKEDPTSHRYRTSDIDRHHLRLIIYTGFSIFERMKLLRFLGDSLKCIRDFPEDARQDAGYQLDKVQHGEPPNDFKPMPTIGRGVEELRIWDDTGTYRVVYTARLADAVYVLHAFQKKTQTTSKRDIDLAKARYTELMRDRK